jgi:hypothetical protein
MRGRGGSSGGRADDDDGGDDDSQKWLDSVAEEAGEADSLLTGWLTTCWALSVSQLSPTVK